jgi:hypothetical protein
VAPEPFVTGRAATPLWLALAGWGAALAAVPRRATRLIGGPQPPPAVVRVLGARRLLQQLVLLRWNSPGVRLAAASVDALHAVSMLAAVRLWPRYRRAELTSAGVSAGSAAVTLLAGRR